MKLGLRRLAMAAESCAVVRPRAYTPPISGMLIWPCASTV